MSDPHEWQSYPIDGFPTLAAAAGKQNKKNRGGKAQSTPKYSAQPATPSAWQNRRPSVPEWSEDDVNAANESIEDKTGFNAAIILEPELKSVTPTFFDTVTARTRFSHNGYALLAEVLVKQMLQSRADPSEPFRSLVLERPIKEMQPDSLKLVGPKPALTPPWHTSLPDRILNEEYKILTYVRPLDVCLGPRALESLLRACHYNTLDRRKLPIYKSDPVVAPPPPTTTHKPTKSSSSQLSQQSDRSTSWNGPSNDVRLSGASSSASSSHHDLSSQYGRQTKSHGMTEFRNSAFPRSSHKQEQRRGGYADDRESRYSASEGNRGGASRSDYDHDWDQCYEKPRSKRYVGYDRHNPSYYRRQEDRIDRDYDELNDDDHNREDSGYHEKEEWVGDRWEEKSSRPVSVLADNVEPARRRNARSPEPPEPAPFEPVDRVVTACSKTTPIWRADYAASKDRSRERIRAGHWRGRWTSEQPEVMEESERRGGGGGDAAGKERRSRGDQLREEDPNARFFWRSTEVPLATRRVLRCLHGVAADSCTALADDMHRVELSTWVGDEDAAEVAARVREAYGIGEMQREEEQRTVLLALPRTAITLAVGAGGDAEILFDDDCAELLVRNRGYDDIRDVVTQRVVKARDFISYEANRSSLSTRPHDREHTVLSFESARAAEDVRDTLSGGGIDARRIPRELITGHWDGSYAQRECLLELTWDRHGVNGFNVRFQNLREQNQLVDRVIRNKGEFFTYAHTNIEEFNNRMYVAVPASPFPLDDDMRFLKDVLEDNGVKVTSIGACRSRDGPQNIDSAEKQSQCALAINRRMLKVAIEQRVWGGFHPRNPQEWIMMLQEGRFSWSTTVQRDDPTALFKSTTNSAVVSFESFDQGDRIASYVQRMTPCASGEDRFILNKEDRKGVFARAKLRVHYNVPVAVHALTCGRLKALDDMWRANSHFSYADFNTRSAESPNQWACLVSDDNTTIVPPGFTRLVVEGFPKKVVEECCAQLLAVIRGDVLTCEGEEREWLLTGIGRNLADAVAREALEKKNVLVDFNVLGKEIRLIGERLDVGVVETRLRRIATNRHMHVIQTRVTIDQPMYMNRTSQAIVKRGGTSIMERVVGDCRLTLCPEDMDKRTLCFEGTVAAYDRFREFLADTDDTLRESASAEYEKLRKTDATLQDPSLSPLTSALVCPICCCRPATDFYRLEACGHVYCTHCIYHQLSSELSTRTLPLKCSRAGCGRKLAVSDLLRLLLGRDPESAAAAGTTAAAAEHLDELKLRPLVTAIVSNALQTKKDKLIACRTVDCEGIFRRLREANDLVRCKTCSRPTCGACGYEPHRGYACEEYERIRDNVDVSMASYMKDKKVRKCPNAACSAVIEKTVGCNHMECVMCRTHFCWLCGHASKTQGEIYSHMQNDHGGNGLHMDDGEMFMLQFDD